MYDDVNELERIILVRNHKQKADPKFGVVDALAESINGSWVPLIDFCHTGHVFIAKDYDVLRDRYKPEELYVLKCMPSQPDPDTYREDNSKYVGIAENSDRLKQKDIIEIIECELPDANRRVIDTGGKYPGTRYVAIRAANDKLYGPFIWDKTPEDESLIKLNLMQIAFSGETFLPGFFFESKECFDELDPSYKLNINNTNYITNYRIFSSKMSEPYMDASVSDIIKFCFNMSGSLHKVRPADTNSIKNLELLATKSPRSAVWTKSYFEQLRSLMGFSSSSYDDITQSLDSFFKKPMAAEFIKSYVEQNKDKYISDLQSAAQDKFNTDNVEKIKKSKEELQNLIRDISAANVELKSIRTQKAEEDLRLQEEAKQDKALIEKRRQLDEIATRLEALTVKYSNLDSIDKLANHRIFLQYSTDELKQQVSALEQSLTDLRAECDLTEDELRRKLQVQKPYIQAVVGGFGGELKLNIPNISVQTNFLNVDGSILDRQRHFVKRLAEQFSYRNRTLSQLDVANILVCCQQSFLTVFAGLPGSGKTSLSRLISSAQNNAKRQLEIPVARGWTGIKDIVGFHNPLSERFQPAATGFFEFLVAHRDELASGSVTQPMSVVILDEANLSPMEHYWHSFIAMTDKGSDYKLRLGQEEIAVPDTMRFIATINYDGSTEPLTNRLIDRAPIILLEHQPLTDYSYMDDAIANEMLPLPASEMNELFGNSHITPNFQGVEQTAFQEIRHILCDINEKWSSPISISPRKELAVRQYCDKLRLFMADDADLKALDYAVKQFILPLISGHGKGFELRLKELRRALDEHSLDDSLAVVDRIISFGNEELNNYQFFCW